MPCVRFAFIQTLLLAFMNLPNGWVTKGLVSRTASSVKIMWIVMTEWVNCADYTSILESTDMSRMTRQGQRRVSHLLLTNKK